MSNPGTPVVKLPLKVVPGASSTGFAGWLGEALRIRVAVPAERGKANAAVEALLRKALKLPQDRVRIVVGGSSPHKIVEISGLTLGEIYRRLGGSPQ